MRLQDIHENYHVKRALEVALIGGHCVALQFTPDAKEIVLQFQEWCIEQNVAVLTMSVDAETNTDIKVQVLTPTEPDTLRWNEPDTDVLKRVKNAQKYHDKESTKTFSRLLESAVKTLKLNDVEKAQLIMVADSISRLDHSEFLEAIYLVEALQYWRKFARPE